MNSTSQSIKGKLFFAIALFALLFAGLQSFAQVTTPDTVCAGSTDVVYGVINPNANSTYYWGISNTTLATLNTGIVPNDSIVNVDYGMTPGDLLIWVYEINEFGCLGDTVYLDIHILDLPQITIDSTIVCHGDSAYITLDITGGAAPYTIEYTDGTNTYTLVTSNPNHVLNLGLMENLTGAPITLTYEILSLEDAYGCETITVGLPTTTVTVNPKPVTQGIYHY